MSHKWTKPKKWGGYDTSNCTFQILDKEGNVLASETDKDWQEKYDQWVASDKMMYMFKC